MLKETKVEGVDYCNLPRKRGTGHISTSGYIMIAVGKDHPLADSNGKAYEHRLVASEVLGRWITKGEQVHHKNGIKTDNHPSNLEVYSSGFEHLANHRMPSSKLRMPGEDNPMIECSCGCGTMLRKFDKENRPRKFVHLHAIPMGQQTLAILALFRERKQISMKDIRSLIPMPVSTSMDCVRRLKKNDFVQRVSHGVWKLRENEK